MSFVASLYGQLLMDPAPPTQLQQRAYKVFMLENNEPALAALAAHPALDPDLDELLGKHKSVKVRLQWASRAGRTKDELIAAFAKEKRITMLEVGAQIKGMPDSWYLKMLSNPSAKVAVHIVGNEEIGLEVRKKAAVIHARTASENRSLVSTLRMVYSALPELHDSLATGGRHSSDVLQFVAGSQLSEENQKAVIDAGVVKFLSPVTGNRYSFWEKQRAATSALQAALAFAKQVSHSPALRQTLLQAISGADLSGHERHVLDLRSEVIEALKSDPVEVVDTMALASTTSDLEQLGIFVKEAVANHDTNMGLAVASNKNITPELMTQVIRAIGWHERRALFAPHKSNPAVLAVLLMHGYESGDDVLDRADNPAEFLEAYLELIAASHASIPAWVMQSKHMRLDMIERTPFHIVAGAELSDTLRKQVMDLVTGSLSGASDEAWSLFEGVANSSGASLGDVIAATTSLSV